MSTLHICAPVEALGKRVSKLESLGKRVSKVEVMYGSLKEVKEEKLAMEAKAIAKLDAIFGRPKEAQEPPKQNEVIVIDSDSDTSLEFYEDTLKKPSASLVNKRPPKTWAKKIPISSISKKKVPVLKIFHQVLTQLMIQVLLMRVMMQKAMFN